MKIISFGFAVSFFVTTIAVADPDYTRCTPRLFPGMGPGSEQVVGIARDGGLFLSHDKRDIVFLKRSKFKEEAKVKLSIPTLFDGDFKQEIVYQLVKRDGIPDSLTTQTAWEKGRTFPRGKSEARYYFKYDLEKRCHLDRVERIDPGFGNYIAYDRETCGKIMTQANGHEGVLMQCSSVLSRMKSVLGDAAKKFEKEKKNLQLGVFYPGMSNPQEVGRSPRADTSSEIWRIVAAYTACKGMANVYGETDKDMVDAFGVPGAYESGASGVSAK